jgi:hypothetical protein
MKIPDGIEVMAMLYLVITCLLGILGDYASRTLGVWQTGVLVAGVLVFTFWLAYTVHFLDKG